MAACIGESDPCRPPRSRSPRSPPKAWGLLPEPMRLSGLTAAVTFRHPLRRSPPGLCSSSVRDALEQRFARAAADRRCAALRDAENGLGVEQAGVVAEGKERTLLAVQAAPRLRPFWPEIDKAWIAAAASSDKFPSGRPDGDDVRPCARSTSRSAKANARIFLNDAVLATRAYGRLRSPSWLASPPGLDLSRSPCPVSSEAPRATLVGCCSRRGSAACLPLRSTRYSSDEETMARMHGGRSSTVSCRYVNAIYVCFAF